MLFPGQVSCQPVILHPGDAVLDDNRLVLIACLKRTPTPASAGHANACRQISPISHQLVQLDTVKQQTIPLIQTHIASIRGSNKVEAYSGLQRSLSGDPEEPPPSWRHA